MGYMQMTRGHQAVAGLLILFALTAGVVAINVRVGKG